MSFISGLEVRFVGVALPKKVEMQGGGAEREKEKLLPSFLSNPARRPDLKALLAKRTIEVRAATVVAVALTILAVVG
jgi:hypothetical protein